MSSILSASTISSSSSSSRVFSHGSTTSTSSTQYSAISGTRTPQDLLSELLDSEATYLKDLKMIDSKIAPLWMKQTTQAAPDFTELIKNTHDIILANKKFYMKLARCAGNTHAVRELGNILLQWVSDLGPPYTNYARSYIPNLNDRNDILANQSITQLLQDLSQSASYNISLDSLFIVPIRHLKYYQDIYTSLLNTEPNYYDIDDLTKAIRYLKGILAVSQAKLAPKSSTSTSPPHIHGTSTSTYKAAAEKRTSDIEQDDFFSYYTEAGELSPHGDSRYVQGNEMDGNGYYGKDMNGYSNDGNEDLSTIQPRTIKILDVIPADPKVATTVTSTATSSRSVVKTDPSVQIQMTFIQPTTAKVMMIDDESTDDEQPISINNITNNIIPVRAQVPNPTPAPAPSKSQVLNPTPTPAPSKSQVLNPTPTPAPSKSQVLNPTPTPAPSKSQVLNPTPTAAPSKSQVPNPKPTSTPSRTPAPSPPSTALPSDRHSSSNQNSTAGDTPTIPPPQQQKSLAAPSNEPVRPISPRAVQVQHAVNPVAAMQAIPQKTNDYFSTSSTKPPTALKESANTNLPQRSSSATPDATVLPRTSSIREPIRNMDSTASSVHSSKPNNGISPIVNHSQSPLSNASSESIGNSSSPRQTHSRSSSLKSTEHLIHSTPPPRMGSNGPLPPRKDSNNARPMSNRSTHSTAAHHQQQFSPHHSTGYQQPAPPQQQDDEQQNGVRQVLYSNNLCEVFRWKDQAWYAVDGQCTVQVRLTFGGRSNVAVLLQPSGQLYLNVWIVPNMVVTQPSPTDISISATMMEQQENYLIHFTHPTDSSNLLAMLHRMHHESSRQQPPPLPSPVLQQQQQKSRAMRAETAAVQLTDDTPSVEDVPQTLQPVFKCKCKLFVQNETSKWHPMGSTALQISHQLPSQKTHMSIDDDKNKLISSIIRSGNVERLTNKRITFLLTDDNDKTSRVYMIQLKDDQNGNRVFDYLKTQNAAHGW